MRYALIALCACATAHRVDVSSTAAAEGQTQTEVQRTTTQGPEKVVTTVEEYAPPEKATAPKGAVGPTEQWPLAVPLTSPHRLPARGPLVKRTVTVTERGPETEIVVAKATGETQTKSETDVKTEDKSRPFGIWALLAAGWPWLLGGGAVVAVGVLWRTGALGAVLGLFRKKPPPAGG